MNIVRGPHIEVTVTIPGNDDRAFHYLAAADGLPLEPDSIRHLTIKALEEATAAAVEASVVA